MIGDNASIVANRRAIRMAGLKAEDTKHSLGLPGGGGSSSTSVSKEEEEEMEVEKQAEEKGAEEAKKSNADAAAALKAAMFASNDDEEVTTEEFSPRGTKRKASASAEGSITPVDEEAGETESEDKVNAFLADSLLPPKPATVAGVGAVVPPELKSMGNNQVEQEDTVK